MGRLDPMWVSVVQLRRDGVKLSRDEVAAAERHQGVLLYEGYLLMGGAGTHFSASLRGTNSRGSMDTIKPIYGARLKAIKGPNLLLVGHEVLRNEGERSREVRQAWWVQVLSVEDAK